MNGLGLLVLTMAAAGFSFWLVLRGANVRMEFMPPELPDVEKLRCAIMRHCGVQISELAIHGGKWHALTAYGWMPVSEVLQLKDRDLRVPGGAQ